MSEKAKRWLPWLMVVVLLAEKVEGVEEVVVVVVVVVVDTDIHRSFFSLVPSMLLPLVFSFTVTGTIIRFLVHPFLDPTNLFFFPLSRHRPRFIVPYNFFLSPLYNFSTISPYDSRR